jgi:peptidoglycan/xylan/chitin deacetylase (PgdA/CDA1 family)
VARAGADVQLHTHRHRTPRDPQLFAREIADNRNAIRAMTGTEARHFCYPSGVYREEFLPWLREQQVLTATTCDHRLASPASHPLLLPRLVDHAALTELEFEGWLCGAGAWVLNRWGRAAR